MLDFTPVFNGEIKLADFAKKATKEDLKLTTEASLDIILDIIRDTSDAELIFIPYDPDAHDPVAASTQEVNIGWSLAHLVLHVTASSEEGAAFSSLLARGISLPAGIRLRYEPHWQDPHYQTKAAILQRLEESRQMRLAYLETWPDQPNLELCRELSERFEATVGKLNAVGSFLLGLKHEIEHHEQFREAARQAKEATKIAQG